MNTNRLGKGTDIVRSILLVIFLAAIGSSVCLADQLQWNTYDVCVEAAQVIAREPLLMSYCSLANADYVEVWFVRDVIVVETAADGLFEVVVLAKRLLISQKPFSSVEFPVHADQWRFNAIHDAGWTIERIDLAYVYTYTGGGLFQCLGKILELDCNVEVETISLPGEVRKIVQPRTCLGPNLSLQPFSLPPARNMATPPLR
ncbi:MAG: hypothetical protein KAQ74_06880 [Dehalococcoidia bacterium]|nr:hypothetical protein [Dehalococcoidia bacterium]